MFKMYPYDVARYKCVYLSDTDHIGDSENVAD